MKRKVLQGAMLFNDYWLGSCYYHQLIAGLGVLGLDGRDVLLNRFLYFKKISPRRRALPMKRPRRVISAIGKYEKI